MRKAGAEIVDPADIGGAGEIDEPELQVLLYEFKADVNQYLATRSGVPVTSLKEAIAFNEKHKDREMPFFGQELFVMAESRGPLSDEDYRKALEKSVKLSREGIDDTLEKHRLDAIVAPTGSPAWPTDLVNGDHFTGSSSAPAGTASIGGRLEPEVEPGRARKIPRTTGSITSLYRTPGRRSSWTAPAAGPAS